MVLGPQRANVWSAATTARARRPPAFRPQLSCRRVGGGADVRCGARGAGRDAAARAHPAEDTPASARAVPVSASVETRSLYEGPAEGGCGGPVEYVSVQHVERGLRIHKQEDPLLRAGVTMQPVSPGPAQLGGRPWWSLWNFAAADSVWGKCPRPALSSGPPGARRHPGSRRWRQCRGCGPWVGSPPALRACPTLEADRLVTAS